MCTFVYVDCGNNIPILLKIVNILMGVVSIGIVVFLITEAVKLFMKMEFKGERMERIISKMKNHYIICGYGILGSKVVEALEKEGAEYVVIDIDPKVIQKLEKNDVLCVEGDALDSKTLEKAGIHKAQMIVCTLASDSSNVFLALTAKEIAPDIKVASRAFSEQAVGKLHRAGAEIIVLPDVIGGFELAREILGIKKSKLDKLISRKEGIIKDD